MSVLNIKQSLLESLALKADEFLVLNGFVCLVKNLEFFLKLPNTVQLFHISLSVHPDYTQGAMAHIYPRVRLSMSQVCLVVGELVAGNPLLFANAPDVMVDRPLEHLVPKSELTQWYIFKEEDFPRANQ